MTTRLSSAAAPAFMLEREAEMAALAATLDAALAGEGRLVIVEGTAGIGKKSDSHRAATPLGILQADATVA